MRIPFDVKSDREVMTEELHLMLFVEWLEANRDVLGTTASSYVSSVKSWHRKNTLHTLGDPNGRGALAELTRQLRRADPPKEVKRDGLSKADLAAAAHSFNLSDLEQLTHWALMQTGIEFVARGCELGRSSEDREPRPCC